MQDDRACPGGAYALAPGRERLEPVISTIKREMERINGRRLPRRHQERLAVFVYIEAFYHRLRIHSALDDGN